MGTKHLKRALIAFTIFVIYSSISTSQNLDKLISRADSLTDLFIFDKAIENGEQAVDLAENLYGSDDTLTARVYFNLGKYYMYAGILDSAEILINKSIAVTQIHYGNNSLKYADALEGLARIEEQRQNFPQAKYYYNEILKIRQNHPDTEDRDLGIAWENLIQVALWEKNYVEAESLAVRALRILESQPNPDLTNITSIYIDKGKALKSRGLYTQASACNLKVIEICKAAGIEMHPNIASAYNNLGVICNRVGTADEAINYFTKSIKMREQLLGRDDPDLIPSLCNLGDNYNDNLGEHHKADSLYNIAYNIGIKCFGKNHPFLSRILEQYSYIAFDLNDTSRALAYFDEAYKIKLRYFYNITSYQSEKDALHYQKSCYRMVNDYLSFMLYIGLNNADVQNYLEPILLTTKGNVSDVIFQRNRSLSDEELPEVTGLYDNIKLLKKDLANLYSRGPSEKYPENYSCRIDALQSMIDVLEADLAFRSADFRKRIDITNLNHESVVSSLPDKSMLLEIYKYSFYDDSSESYVPAYLVMGITKSGNRKIVNLDSAAAIDSLINAYRNHMYNVALQDHPPVNEDLDEYKIIAKKLFAVIIEPFENELEESKTLIVAPDGAFNFVSFAGLVDDSDRYLIENIAVHYVSTGRDLINYGSDELLNKGLFVMGNPDYNYIARPELRLAGATGTATGNLRSGCGNLAEIELGPLPNTQHEIDEITRLWKTFNSEPMSAFTQGEATEDNFKAFAPGNRVIHLATHGYYLEGLCKSGEKNDFADENPLLQSGLFFAGANFHGQYADSLGIDDGILSAYEVSSLSLEGVQLAVLSACETGLGEIRQSEGVYGLRRAFQMAGVHTIISTLWPISDDMSTDMINLIYSNSNAPIYERMRDMQLAQINKLRNSGYVDHPYSWAGYVAFGGH